MLDSISEYSFPTESQPIYDALGQPINGHKAIVRTDTDEVLGVHGSRYKMLSNDDVVNSMMDAVKDANISHDHTLSVEVTEGGRKMRGEILFNDLVSEPAVGDIMKFRVSFFNSYDGSRPFGQRADALRLWCLNGCMSPVGMGYTRWKHTNNVSVDGAASKMRVSMDTFFNDKALWQNMMAHKIDSVHVENFFKKTLAKQQTVQRLKEKTNEKQLENLLSLWHIDKRQLGSNQWALYNAMTYWSSHTEDSRNPSNTRYIREGLVSAALQSKHWGAL